MASAWIYDDAIRHRPEHGPGEYDQDAVNVRKPTGTMSGSTVAFRSRE